MSFGEVCYTFIMIISSNYIIKLYLYIHNLYNSQISKKKIKCFDFFKNINYINLINLAM